MAIQSISNPQMAYQGSVSGAETAKEAPEKSAGVVTEAVSVEKNAEPTVISEDTLAQNDNGNSSKSNSTKGAGTEALKKAAEEIRRNSRNSEAVFGVHDGTNRITIKIIDKDTKEVLI